MSYRPTLAGFAEPYAVEYPAAVLTIGALVLFVASVIGTLEAVALIRGEEMVVSLIVSFDVITFGVVPLTIVVHEAIHGTVARALGYHVTFGFGRLGRFLPIAYAAWFGQVTSRRDNALVLAAPLVLISTIGVVALALAPSWLLPATFVMLVVNTSGAVGDCYALWRVARLPRGSVFYDESLSEMLVYELIDS